MPFDHERLNVYNLALEFVVIADDVIEHFPRGRSHLADQLHRATTSIVLNIAEGAGKFSRPDKRRYYLSAIGSATECAAIFDVLLRLRVVSATKHAEAKQRLDSIASMLVNLAKSLQREQRGEGEGGGGGEGGGEGEGGGGGEGEGKASSGKVR